MEKRCLLSQMGKIRLQRSSICLAIACSLAALSQGACGKSEDASAAAATPPASPAPAANSQDAAVEAKMAEMKAEREAAAAAKAKEKADKDAKIDAITVLPAKMPKSKDKTCDAMTKAYGAYMSSIVTGEVKEKWDAGGSEMQLKIIRAGCAKGSLEAAACQIEALKQMTPDLKSDLPTVIHRCSEKFPGGEPAPKH
jgi:hypothetical protein